MTEAQSTLTPDERRKVYKKTLNLPRTAFAMKANLSQNEPQSQRRWQELDLYHRRLEANRGAPRFVFHDGPPYANGSIHVGHLLNKVLKDLVVRSRNMTGRHCAYVPGWDCHGLPIEHRVMTELLESQKLDKLRQLPEDTQRMAVRRECERFAEKFKKQQAEQMQRLSTLADYDHPYLTMRPGYEAKVLEVFADMVDQGLVYRALRPVHWSIANETALAEAELEYYERVDRSVYAAFQSADGKAAAAFGYDGEEPLELLIWTTTPWTLPANLLIAVHPRLEYALLRSRGRLLVVARELAAKVAAMAGDETPEIVATAPGSALLGAAYRHPFIDREGTVVGADYVNLDEGTGLVHTAPGHGAEDFQTGRAHGIAPYSPVRDDGTFDDTVPEFLRGLSVWDANAKIVERLAEVGSLYYDHEYKHSYPHDWRSKTPVIFRCTEQWFIAVDQDMPRDGKSLRRAALDASAQEVDFVPAWGAKRLHGMLESRPDWCISRQRAWGLPIPAFRLASGEVLLTAATVRAIAAVFAKEGSDAWFLKGAEELLAAYDPGSDPEVDGDLDLGGAAKMHDIFDVWFESGSSWNAVLRARDLGYPADLYLEGSDQHRGWFQQALLTGLGATGQSPFRTLLTHGFIVDKDGRKMSKSLGNTLDVEDLLRDYGADVLRWWVSQLAFENDIKVDRQFFDEAGESYRKVRNTLRFLLSNLGDFEPGMRISAEELAPQSLDRWALAQASRLRSQVVAAYECYDFRRAHLLLFDFCNETLSAVYLDAVKDRLYCDRPDSERRRRTQSCLYTIAELLCTLLAPMLPHTADEAYRALIGADDATTTVHLQSVPELDVSADDGWTAVMQARERVLKALEDSKSGGIENPLDAGVRLADPEGRLAAVGADLADVLRVSRVELDGAASDRIEILDLRDEPRCERSWRRDATVRERGDGGWLSDRDAEAVGVS